MKNSFVILLILMFVTGFASAEIVKIAIEANVTGITDEGNYLESNINVGDTITGYYIYDTSTQDSEPSESLGRYWHYSYPCGVYLACNDLEFQTDPEDTEFLLQLADNSSLYDFEGYLFNSYNNLTANDTPVDTIRWYLEDKNLNNLHTDNLFTYAPDLLEWDFNQLDIRSDRNFNIHAEVTFAEVIPEPSSILLLGLGSMLIKRKNK